MTVDEKRKELNKFCKRMYENKGCSSCIFYNNTCVFDDMVDSEINEKYNYMIGVEEVSAVHPHVFGMGYGNEQSIEISKDTVNHPSHYADGKIEPIDYIEDKKLGFCLGNAVKYISRAGKKPGNDEITDLKKAIWYIERRIKEVENGD